MVLPALLLAVAIDHQPLDCLVKGRFARIDAVITPASEVTRARVYFKRDEAEEFYAVDMVLHRGRFGTRLPKPRDTGQVLYFVEAVEQDGSVRRTATMAAEVVSLRRDCSASADEDEDVSDVRVLAPGGAGKPKGFSGVSRVSPLDSRAKATEDRAAAPAREPTSGSRLPPAIPAPRPLPSEDPGADYRIGPEDILRVTVYGHEDLTQTVVVQTDGTFVFPLVGRVTASGTTPKELERTIVAALSKGFVRSPQVTVVVHEYRSQSVFVVGEVARPGTYPLQGRTTVVEVLAKAGPTSSAGYEVVVVRPRVPVEGPLLPAEVGEDETQAEVIRVNLREIKMGKLDQNILLRPRDTVFVSEAAKVFVSGEVRNGGAYTFAPGITVRQAISMAGGFTPEASHSRLRVVRMVDGKSREVKVELDDPLQPGDTIVVKTKLF